MRLAASYAIDRRAISEAETLGASKPTGSIVPRAFEFALPIEPHPYDPARPSSSWPRPAIPNGFDAGELHVTPPYYLARARRSMNYLGAVGIKARMRPMERAAFFAAWAAKKLQGRLRVRQRRSTATPPRACRRSCRATAPTPTAAIPTSTRSTSSRRVETDRKKREAMLHQIQQLLHERVRFAPIFDYLWPSGIGPRVEEPALMLINPYPWSAPLEEVRLKKK